MLPQAFGGFERSLVLRDAVCMQCNSFFSRELELKFARDSIEGHARFAQGVTKPSEFKSIASASTSHGELPDRSATRVQRLTRSNEGVERDDRCGGSRWRVGVYTCGDRDLVRGKWDELQQIGRNS